MTDAGPMDFQHQTLNFSLPGGEIIPIPLDVFDSFVQYGIRICINYGTQIGASVVLLAVLVILTKAEKRSTAVFVLNVSALVFNIIRNIIQCVYFTGPFYQTFVYFSGDYSLVPRGDYATSVTGVVFYTLMVIAIEASLVLQVRAVCVTMTRNARLVILILSFLVATTTIGLRLALTVQNARAIVSSQSFYGQQWLAAASLYMITASICFFSAIFTAKLAVALKQRRSLGLRQFGPMQIIFIMGCQTLIVPAIFSILQWVTSAPELGSQVLTIVAIFLPLSAMWASKSLSGAPGPSMINSKGRSGFLGFLSGRSNFFSRGGSKIIDHSTASSDSPITPHYSVSKADDLENGDMKIYRTQDVQVSSMQKSDF